MANEASTDAANATLRDFTSGQKLFNRYTLVRILGRGGMGIVWLAQDEELEREVALKFLPDLIIHDRALLNELKRETKRSLELTHKNIVRIYDFVHDERSGCISMEYIDGETLSNLRAQKKRKVFEPNEIGPWTSQLCDALDYAHNHARIIHRDLKPANLMVNQKGDLKVSDFGIARSLGDSMSKLTMASGTSGTLTYMSPQQLDGERGTHLDDIYSLGATLYDLLTSKPPFYSGNIARQIHDRVAPSIAERRKDLNIEPASVPAIWEEVVAACLKKDPAQRPQSTAEVANRLQLGAPRTGWRAPVSVGRPKNKTLLAGGLALLVVLALGGWYLATWQRQHKVKSLTASPSQSVAVIPEKSIAVLPFENLSTEKDDAFFAEGLQDDVLTSLGKIKDLTVIARASVMTYRGAAVAGKLREIGQTLHVAHVLQGSVRRSGDRVVMNVALVDTRNDRQLWSERYERTMNDMLSLQGELAVQIARELRASLTLPEQRAVAAKPTDNPDAYVLYLRARELEIIFGASPDDYENAVKLYQQAIDLDPKFALARARLSFRLAFLAAGFPGRFSGQMPRALAEAEEALRLQPNLGEGRLALAYYYFRAKTYFQAKSDLDRALAELSRAEELMPNSAEVWSTRAQIYKRQDKLRERISALEHAEALDPRDTNTLGLLVGTFRSVRNWREEAQTMERITAVLHPNSGPNVLRAYCEFRRSGFIDPLKNAIAGAPAATPPTDLSLARYELAMLERDYSAAEGYLHEIPAGEFDDWTGAALLPPKTMLEALLAVARNADAAVIERAFVLARRECEKVLAENPEFFDLYGSLGLIDAFRGLKEDAIREGRRWLELENYSMLEKNDAAANLALIYARTGEPDEAIKLIEQLLTVPANLGPFEVISMTQAELKWGWVWDPIRNDPRFQKILAGPEPKTIY